MCVPDTEAEAVTSRSSLGAEAPRPASPHTQETRVKWKRPVLSPQGSRQREPPGLSLSTARSRPGPQTLGHGLGVFRGPSQKRRRVAGPVTGEAWAERTRAWLLVLEPTFSTLFQSPHT